MKRIKQNLTKCSNSMLYVTSILLLIVVVSNISYIFGATDDDISYRRKPKVITKGGKYSGNWQSKDPNVAAVTIKTDEPVLIYNSNLRGPGNLIENTVAGCNLTVRNTRGFGILSDEEGLATYKGRFISISRPKNILVENNEIESCSFAVYIYKFEGDGSVEETIKIRKNKIKNIDGREWDGSNYNNKKWLHNCGIQLNDVESIANCEISWNEIINIPYESSVGDVINLYDSFGTPQSYIQIHNNYVRGGYYTDPTAKNSGLGIIVDGQETTSDQAPKYINIFENQTLNMVNGGIGVTIGSYVNVYSNRTINSGKLPGLELSSLAPGFGMGILSYHASPEKEYMDGREIKIYDNVSGWMSQKRNHEIFRQDYYIIIGESTNNESIEEDISKETEQAEFQLWQNKIKKKEITLGVEL